MLSFRSACLSDNEVSHFVSGGALGADLLRIEGHIAECTECGGVVRARAESFASGELSIGSLDDLGRHASTDPFDADDAVDATRYEVHGEIARGGMGRILEAWDRQHRRPVAIKVLLHGGPALEARFAREVAVTARLQHPSIVTLYDAGRSPKGAPFFVMKRVLGRSLAAVVDDAKTLESRLALLPHLIAVTEALAYAHQQRVIHRDLKPANVLIGTFGETVVIDWGLSKEVGPAGEASPPESHDRAGRGNFGDAAISVLGHALGTPCYMSPEQARGEHVDERSDIYALGALLYHVLAGGPPFVDVRAREVLRKVLAGAPVPLTEREARLPADLVAVVERAMAHEPDQRYGTALEMAADLRRFTLGQLVTAHAYGWTTLAGRWIRRHRALVTMAALFAVGGALTGALGIRRVVQERDRADRERVVAEEEGRRASAHSAAAEALVDYSVGELRKELTSVGRVDLLAGLGGEVEKYYGALASLEEGRRAATLMRRALGLDLLGEAAVTKHDLPAARAREDEAVALLERALAVAPGDRAARSQLVEAELRLAAVDTDQGMASDALAHERRAADEARRLVDDAPDDARAGLLAVRAERDLTEQLMASGEADTDAALDAARAVPALLAQRVAADPTDADMRLELADSYITLGTAYGFFGRDDEMVASEHDALTTLDSLDSNDPRVQDYRGSALQLSAGAELSRGRAGAALDLAQRALVVREGLVARDPANADWHRRLGLALGGIAASLRELGRPAEALPFSVRALRLAEDMAVKSPGNGSAQGHVARALGDLATVLAAKGEPVPALAALEKARAIFEKLAPTENYTWRWLLSDALGAMGTIELGMGRVDRALAHAAAADDLAEALTPLSDDEILLLRARERGLLGRARAAHGENEQARRALIDAGQDFDAFWARGHDRTEWLRGAPEAARALASLRERDGQRAEARKTLAAALGPLETLETAGRLPVENRALLSAVRADLTRLAP